jgi:mannosylfructose-phosphate synthase
MADLYRAADVFVLSSRYEPFGMTAVEAMACGTPTVVTTHGGLFRVLRFGISGLFADAFDPMDLGITILKPLRHPPLAERLSRYGAEAARSQFTWTGIAQQLIAATEQRLAEDAATRVVLADFEPVTRWSDPKVSHS